MADRVFIPLPGIGTLELTREEYEAALRPIEPAKLDQTRAAARTELVTARALAAQLSLPVSSLYQYAKAGRIPCIRAGKTVRFSPPAVLAALSATGGLTGGRA